MIIHKYILEDSENFLEFLKKQKTILEKCMDANMQGGKQRASQCVYM